MNYTSIEQSNKLLELGLSKNTADCFYTEFGDVVFSKPCDNGLEPAVPYIPCWSVGKLLEIIPLDYKVEKTLFDQSGMFTYSVVTEEYRTYESENLVDACVEMLVWLLGNDEDVKNYLTRL